MKPFFNPEDFIGKSDFPLPQDIKDFIAKQANDKLEKEGIVMYGDKYKDTDNCKNGWKDYNGIGPLLSHTHKGLLINIEPLGCQHIQTIIWEPHLAGTRKCTDCGLVYNPNKGEWHCEHPIDKVYFDEGIYGAWKSKTLRCECGAKVTPSKFSEVQ